MSNSKKALTLVGTRDDGTFQRTAIFMKAGSTESIDIVAADGTLFCRINVSEFEDGNRGNVDVILEPARQSACMTAYANAKRFVHGVIENSAVHSVAINKRT